MEGIADLPLHEGHVPSWLIKLMKHMSKAIVEIIVEEYGTEKLLERLSNPLWFQAFNNIIGMDWDSSGSTTVTLGILKDVLKNGSLGIMVLGGKGKKARRVPEEIIKAADILGLTSTTVKNLMDASKIIAKVDSTMLQDGYTLYHHSLIVSETGLWSVIQQGMNVKIKMARRYHWYSKYITSFVEKPHSAIAGIKEKIVLNLIDNRAKSSRETILDLSKENPKRIIGQYFEALKLLKNQEDIRKWINASSASITIIDEKKKTIYYMPKTAINNIRNALRLTYENQPRNLEEMLKIRGVGPTVIRALTLVADLIYNEPPSIIDPVTHPYDPFKYAYAVGGKDGIPYPVNRAVMIKTIENLEEIIYKAKIGGREKLRALRKLKTIARYIE